MLEFYQKNAEKSLIPPNQIPWHPNTFKQVDVRGINAWQDELSASELETIELMNCKNLEKLGYRREVIGNFQLSTVNCQLPTN